MLEWIVSSTLLILTVIALRFVSRGRISLRMRYALWLLVLLRLLIPVNFGATGLSVGNFIQQAKQIKTSNLLSELTQMNLPRMVSGMTHTETINEYAEKGAASSEPPREEYEVVDYEIPSRMDGAWSLRGILTVIWLFGVSVVGLVILISNLSFAVKLKNIGQALVAPRSPLPVYLSPEVETPCLFGLFRLAIYVTPEATADNTALHHVIEHELTHLRHGDPVWSLLRCVCLALHWYNPVVWWAASLSRRDSELACDEATVQRIGEDERAEYGRTLIKMTCQKRQNMLRIATTMTGNKTIIKERIMYIAKKPKPTLCAFVAVLLTAAVTVGCTFTGPGREEDPPLSSTSGADHVIQDGDSQETQDIIDDIPGVLLSEEELARFNETFTSVETRDNDTCFLPVNGFFTSLYDDVTELNLIEFLRYYPANGALEEEDAAEFEILSKHPDFPWNAQDFEKAALTVYDLPVPTHRILRSSVDETLQKYAGITTADLKNVEGVLYLPEYDAYYNFTSDFGPGVFHCAGGKRDGTTVQLWSELHGFDGSREILTLREADGKFYIKSFQNTKFLPFPENA